ncbi:MAG TPA: energy transducer TonB [Thermoanaerobaculia bacterium]|jgi:protein TonB|nr:energy transducer TonB [Thermoanaerobaculia bacterium]
MFEHSLIDLAATKRPRRRWLSLPAAIMIHAAAFGAFMLASYWQVEAVPATPMVEPFVVQLPPPPPPALGSGKPAATKPEVVVKKEAVKPVTSPETVQPEVVADLKPQTESPVLENLGLPPDGDPHGVEKGGVQTGGDPNSDARYSETMAPPVVTPTAEPVNDRPIQVGGAVLKPEVIVRTEPRYTEMARKARVEGVVILKAIIDERGYVTDVQLLRGQPMGLDQAAMDAVRTWRFKPATLHGQPVKVYFNLTVNFTLQR